MLVLGSVASEKQADGQGSHTAAPARPRSFLLQQIKGKNNPKKLLALCHTVLQRCDLLLPTAVGCSTFPSSKAAEVSKNWEVKAGEKQPLILHWQNPPDIQQFLHPPLMQSKSQRPDVRARNIQTGNKVLGTTLPGGRLVASASQRSISLDPPDTHGPKPVPCGLPPDHQVHVVWEGRKTSPVPGICSDGAESAWSKTGHGPAAGTVMDVGKRPSAPHGHAEWSPSRPRPAGASSPQRKSIPAAQPRAHGV